MKTILVNVALGGHITCNDSVLGRCGEHANTTLQIVLADTTLQSCDFIRLWFGDRYTGRLNPVNGTVSYAVPEEALIPPAVRMQVCGYKLSDGQPVLITRSDTFRFTVETSVCSRILCPDAIEPFEVLSRECAEAAAGAMQAADSIAADLAAAAESATDAAASASAAAESASSAAAAAEQIEETAEQVAADAASVSGLVGDATSAASSAGASAAAASASATLAAAAADRAESAGASGTGKENTANKITGTSPTMGEGQSFNNSYPSEFDVPTNLIKGSIRSVVAFIPAPPFGDVHTVTDFVEDGEGAFNYKVDGVAGNGGSIDYDTGACVMPTTAYGQMQIRSFGYSVQNFVYDSQHYFSSESTKALLDKKVDKPDTDGDSGDVLTTDGAGHYSWAPQSGGSEYTPGEGIDLTENVISVDTDVVEEKENKASQYTEPQEAEYEQYMTAEAQSEMWLAKTPVKPGTFVSPTGNGGGITIKDAYGDGTLRLFNSGGDITLTPGTINYDTGKCIAPEGFTFEGTATWIYLIPGTNCDHEHYPTTLLLSNKLAGKQDKLSGAVLSAAEKRAILTALGCEVESGTNYIKFV